MKKIVNDWRVKETLHEEDISATSLPPANADIAQKLGQLQIALNKEDLKLQNLTNKIMLINKRKAQIQKMMVQAQEENARTMQKNAKETAKQEQMNQQAADQAAEAQAQSSAAQTPVTPTGNSSESLLQSEFNNLELLEDHIVVLMQSENPDYEKINQLIEVNMEDWNCPGCGKPVKRNDPNERGSQGVCNDCEVDGLWVDPAGGVHQEPDDGEFYDPASMYENNPMSKENFYLNEAEVEKKTEDFLGENYIHYIKIYEKENDWFIAKIFKESTDGDWFGEVKAGESDNFDDISYDSDYDLIDIIDFLKKTYDSVEVIDDAEYNDYVEETPPGELDEEGGITGMHI